MSIERRNPRFDLFKQLFPDQSRSSYPGWIRKHSDDFRSSRHIYSDTIPADMQSEFTDWLRLQYMEIAKHA